MSATAQLESAPAISKLRLQRILVPMDLSAESQKSLRYAIAFARQFNAELLVIHVVEPPPPAAGFESVTIAMDEGQVAKNLEVRLGQFASANVPSDIATKTLVRHGSAFEEIVSVAKSMSIDLIIASTHGHTGFKRVLFGSTAERLVQHAPCPLLIVREREHEFLGSSVAEPGSQKIQLQKILVPIDFSDCSRKALRYAIALAGQFTAQILCLHALEIPYGTGEAAVVLETEAFRKRMHEEAQKQMTVFIQEEAAPLSEECTIKLGTPYREIIQTADDKQIDLIILGTHGRSGVRHFLVGSTTERVVRHAHCPVLVVREQEHEFIVERSALA
jgi:nucleotide-binding universal stress UspA family protein